MTGLTRAALGVIAMTLLAGAAGGWLGVRYGMAEARHGAPSLDTVIHEQLDLTTEQRRRIGLMEAAFVLRQRALQSQMRDANRQLARALVSEHRYGPAAHEATEQFHAAMKVLQEETILHILAMRAVLTPAQAQQFDQTVSQVLDSGEP